MRVIFPVGLNFSVVLRSEAEEKFRAPPEVRQFRKLIKEIKLINYYEQRRIVILEKQIRQRRRFI